MSAARRSLLTATAAGTLLAALWFVPSANATPEKTAEADQQQTATAVHTQSDSQLRLADTGTVDTTPYLIGGTAFLGIGAGFLTYSARRGRTAY
ncbi:hypothetical protein ACFVTY_29500 [Streptomyces sp. NPDC058067]|uniref:hypothetical protein n=1 Tax=Streptomyces sp. NPDC058067 TaxID=3346324 RepID=UPI0036E2C93D